MKYVLDTNAVSAVMKGDPVVLDRLRRLPKDQVGVPAPVVAELAYGIARLGRTKRAERLRRLLELVRSELPRVAWTEEVSDRFGEIKADLERRGEPIEDFDACIAAHALASGATLVTANAAHLRRVHGLELEDWTR